MSEENVKVSEKEPETPKKTTRWVGVACIVLFFVLGGWSVCPWYMWIVFVFLALITMGGESMKGQAILGVALVLFGTTITHDREDDYSGYQAGYENSRSVAPKQSKSEQQQIEKLIKKIELLNEEFENADRNGLTQEQQQRISDEAWYLYQELKKMNLTKEQWDRVGPMFTL